MQAGLSVGRRAVKDENHPYLPPSPLLPPRPAAISARAAGELRAFAGKQTTEMPAGRNQGRFACCDVHKHGRYKGLDWSRFDPSS